MKCRICNADTVTKRYGNDYFVMCESSACRTIRDPEAPGAGRPLSNAGSTPAIAEADYARTEAARKEASLARR